MSFQPSLYDLRLWAAFRNIMLFISGIILSATFAFADVKGSFLQNDFVGSWHSDQAGAVIKLNDDSTWEIPVSGQTGWWVLRCEQIVWMYDEFNVETADDANDILSYVGNEFRIRELDGSITVFKRAD